jgi:hypothetical protein
MAGKAFILEFADLGGGLNESAADSIAEREASALQNLYPVGRTSLWSREGRVSIADAYSEVINSIARYNPSFTEDEYTIVGAAASVGRLVGTEIQALSVADGRIYPSLTNRWWFRQYNDEMFACQKGNGGVKRIYGDSIMEAGIAAPTLKPQIADGGAGQKGAGTYQLAYSFFNTETGAESNLSPASLERPIEGNHCLSVTNLGTSSSLQVNARRIYATLPDDLGTFYLVGQINDNVQTTFTENAKNPDDYGARFGDENGFPQNGLPPSKAVALETGKERLFVTDGQGIYWSEVAKLQSFKAASYYPVSRDDGYEVTGLKWWEDHGLVILKQNRAMLLRGSGPGDWDVVQISDEHGSPAGQSAVVADGVLYYYTGVNFVRSGDGRPEILPQIDRVRTTIDSIPDANKGDVQGEVLPERKWVVWTVQTDADRVLLIYDYAEGVWTTITDAPYTIKRLVKSDQSEVLLSSWADEDELAEFLTGTDDDGDPITCLWRSKAFDRGGFAFTVNRVSLLTPAINGTVTIRTIRDMDGVYVCSRTGVSLNRAGWKHVTIPGNGHPGMLYQIEVVYSGTRQFKLSQVKAMGEIHPRRIGRLL